MHACKAQKHKRRIICAQTEKHYYLNIAKTKPSLEHAGSAKWVVPARVERVPRPAGRVVLVRPSPSRGRPEPSVNPSDNLLARQAVRSLGPLRCACYQACTCGLSTSSSGWDLDCSRRAVGRLLLDAASRLDAFSAYPFWT
jgi:hypothetical protein